jgi:hypothetical protein
MRVSEFLIGRGEVYVSRYWPASEQARRFVEVVAFKPSNGGRHILIADHEHGQRVPGSERIVFGAGSFLRCYRPATAADCRASSPD